MLRELPDGSAIMFHPPRDHVCFSHDENSEQKGKRGVASLEERLKILKESARSNRLKQSPLSLRRRLRKKAAPAVDDVFDFNDEALDASGI